MTAITTTVIVITALFLVVLLFLAIVSYKDSREAKKAIEKFNPDITEDFWQE